MVSHTNGKIKTVALSKDEIHTGNLILVNQLYPYKANISGKMLNQIEDDVLLERQFAVAYEQVIEAINAHESIVAVSGWRAEQEQEQIYNDSLAANGKEFTSKYVALPGHSEHQTGLAVDVAYKQTNIDFLRPHFPSDGICEDFRIKARYFGLIERYPKDKENITGIAYEPWHFRYVGAPHALIMQDTEDTLEEYHERLKNYRYGASPLKYDFGNSKIEISYLEANGGTVFEAQGKSTGKVGDFGNETCAVLEIENDAIYTVSGNNIDGFIITMWK